MRCSICGEDKNPNDFYPTNRIKCKKCYIKDVSSWQKNNPHYKERKKARQQTYYREWYKKHGRKRNKNYVNLIKLWQQNNKEKKRAIGILNYAVKTGKIEKSSFCNICGENNIRINGHHSDYDEPLKVLWCCSSCHKKIHYEKDFT